MTPQGPNGEVNGTDILVQVEHPAGSGNFLTIGSQRGATFNENTNPVDMSSKENRAGFFNPGRYTSTISLESMYIPTSSGYAMMRNAMRDGTYIMLRRFELGNELEEAECVITSMSQSAPDQDASIVSAEFQLNGEWVPVP